MDERSTINPKLYSLGVPITFLSEVDTKFSEINRLRKATIKHPKTSELFRRFPKLTRRLPQIPKFTRERPKICEVEPKNLDGVRGSTKVFQRFQTWARTVSKVSEVNTNGSHTASKINPHTANKCHHTKNNPRTLQTKELLHTANKSSHTANKISLQTANKNFFAHCKQSKTTHFQKNPRCKQKAKKYCARNYMRRTGIGWNKSLCWSKHLGILGLLVQEDFR